MAALAPASTSDLLALLHKSNVLSPERLAAVPPADALPADPRAAAGALVRQGLLTKFQSAQLLAGRHKGFRVGPYAVLDLLGRGGMGAVYLAEHLELGRKVAVKVLAPAPGEGRKLAAERFLREGRAAAALDHPNIVRVFDVARHGETPYLVMEYVDGETLQQAVDGGSPMPVARAAEAVAQAAAGLQHAHERGFVHRDIKPGNLIRDRRGVVKILDMGLARSGSEQDKLTEQLDHGAVVGTADYISPEQALNHPDVDGRADIYSLGATLYTLLAGQPPFDGNTTQKLIQHQMKNPPPLSEVRPDVPPGLAAVVGRMLAKKPADRYPCGAEVAAALAPWAGASARVASGLSQTDLGRGAPPDRPAPPAAPGSGVLEAAASGHETVEVRAEETLRTRPAPAPPAPRRRSRLVVVALVVLLFSAAGVAGFLAAVANRDSGPAPEPASTPEPASQPAPKAPPNAAPKAAPSAAPKSAPNISAPQPPVAAERVVFRLDAADLPDFAGTRTGRTRSGGSAPPAIPGVAFVGYKAETESAWTCGPVAGARAIGFTNVNDVLSAQIAVELESPQGAKLVFEPGQVVRARVVYRTAGRARGTAYFQTPVGWKTFASARLPNSNDAWATAEVTVTRGADPLRFVIDVGETGAGNTLYVRSLTVAVTDQPKK